MGTILEASLHTILSCPRQQLGHMFYDEFLSACPEAAMFFRGLDLELQAKVFINNLQAVVACKIHRYPAVDAYLKLLGYRHLRREIPPELYPRFRDAMLRTLAGFHGTEWSDELEIEWRQAFDLATQAMLSGYSVGHVSY